MAERCSPLSAVRSGADLVTRQLCLSCRPGKMDSQTRYLELLNEIYYFAV